MKYPVPWKQPRTPRFSHHYHHHHGGQVLVAWMAWMFVWMFWAMFALVWFTGVLFYLFYKWLIIGTYKGGKALLVAGVAKYADRRVEPVEQGQPPA